MAWHRPRRQWHCLLRRDLCHLRSRGCAGALSLHGAWPLHARLRTCDGASPWSEICRGMAAALASGLSGACRAPPDTEGSTQAAWLYRMRGLAMPCPGSPCGADWHVHTRCDAWSGGARWHHASERPDRARRRQRGSRRRARSWAPWWARSWLPGSVRAGSESGSGRAKQATREARKGELGREVGSQHLLRAGSGVGLGTLPVEEELS